jgi:hypothetical protein
MISEASPPKKINYNTSFVPACTSTKPNVITVSTSKKASEDTSPQILANTSGATSTQENVSGNYISQSISKCPVKHISCMPDNPSPSMEHVKIDEDFLLTSPASNARL